MIILGAILVGGAYARPSRLLNASGGRGEGYLAGGGGIDPPEQGFWRFMNRRTPGNLCFPFSPFLAIILPETKKNFETFNS